MKSKAWREVLESDYAFQDEIPVEVVKSILKDLEKAEAQDIPEPEPCRHLNSRLHAEDAIGTARCPDCGGNVMIFEVLNNWFDVLHEFLKRE